MVFTDNPYVSIAIILGVVFVLGSIYSLWVHRGQNREAAYNAKIAERTGVRYIHRPTTQPTGVFDVYKHNTRLATHFAIDPDTNDWSMQLYYFVPPPFIHLRGDHGESYNLSFATVTTGFWIIDNIVIFPKPLLGMFRRRYLTGNAEFDKRWVVSSADRAPIPAIMTPGVIDALMHPPFEFKKDTKITFRGPQMAIETQLIEFEKRVELLRWCQHLVRSIDTHHAPGYGQFTIEPQHTTGNELPSTIYDFPEGDQPELGADIGRDEIEADDDADSV